MAEAVAHLVKGRGGVGEHDEVGVDDLLKHVDVADLMGHVKVVVTEIDGAEVIPIGDAFEHGPHGRIVEDVPIERVTNGDKLRTPGRGVEVVNGRSEHVGRFLYGPNEVHQAFEVGIGLEGALPSVANPDIDHVGVAQVFHVADEGVGAVDGGEVAPVRARLRKQRIAHRVFHLNEPFTQVDVVDAQLFESCPIEVVCRDFLFLDVAGVFGHMLAAN